MFIQMTWTKCSLYIFCFCLQKQKKKKNSYQNILQSFSNSIAHAHYNYSLVALFGAFFFLTISTVDKQKKLYRQHRKQRLFSKLTYNFLLVYC